MTTTTSTTAERTNPMGNKDNQNQIGNWGEWEPWDVCSATCGKGVTTRRRTCSPVGAKCQGDNTETDECLLTPCCVPRNGMWGDWSDWSTCSSSCGGGSHTRSRICTGTNSCGQYCQGKSNESTACNVQACLRPPAVPSITTNPQTSPFSAGVTVTLTCSSPDLGSPPATLTWDTAREGMRTTRVNDQRIQLQLLNLSVEDDERSVKCLASNTVSLNETSFVLRVDKNASYGECRASVSSSTWEVTGYCDIIQVFSSNNQYDCQWYEIKGSNTNNIPSSFNLSLITPGGKLQRGKCGFQTKIPRDFPQGRELSRELKYQMYFNPGGTWSPIVNVTVVFPVECSDNLTDCPRLATRCADSFVQEFCRKTCSRCHVHRDSSDAASMATMFSLLYLTDFCTLSLPLSFSLAESSSFRSLLFSLFILCLSLSLYIYFYLDIFFSLSSILIIPALFFLANLAQVYFYFFLSLSKGKKAE
ncbi:uncharacterized protein LOC112568847 isoform X2 [Pomacea canaliculata]|nr:uncharacterized protein LOC112568847 isoform X2 [Pomacea canaliculata]